MPIVTQRNLKFSLKFLTTLRNILFQGPTICHERFLEPVCHLCTCSIQVWNCFNSVIIARVIFSHVVGHSLTIVGLEERKNGSLGLLVLDPMFKPSPAILSLIGIQFNSTAPEKLLKAYRRGKSYLSEHPNFEILR